jgi:hypothetical protein
MATAPARAKGTSAEDSSHSGRLLLRMPPALHGDLARAAERDGTSLNTYITRILSEAVRGGAERPAGGGRLLRYAIIADLVLVAVAAVAAVALLIAAA